MIPHYQYVNFREELEGMDKVDVVGDGSLRPPQGFRGVEIRLGILEDDAEHVIDIVCSALETAEAKVKRS